MLEPYSGWAEDSLYSFVVPLALRDREGVLPGLWPQQEPDEI